LNSTPVARGSSPRGGDDSVVAAGDVAMLAASVAPMTAATNALRM
jgi:hypothetical protein